MEYPEAICAHCGKTQTDHGLFLTEVSCSLECDKKISREDRVKAMKLWYDYYDYMKWPYVRIEA